MSASGPGCGPGASPGVGGTAGAGRADASGEVAANRGSVAAGRRRAAEPDAGGELASYGRGARILTLGIASTGLFSFLYLALASNALAAEDYGRVALMWSVLFVILAVIYRPVEQLLSRTIAERRARGLEGHPLRVPAAIQLAFAGAFAAVALALRGTITERLYGGADALFWLTLVAVLAYAGSYFARGWLAGHTRFGLYGALVLLESVSRFMFAVAAVAGVTSGQSAVAAGMTAAPFVSLVVVPFAYGRLRRRAGDGTALASRNAGPGGAGRLAAAAEREPSARSATAAADAPTAAKAQPTANAEEPVADLTLRHGSGFAIAVVAIMLAEQTVMNAAVLIVNASAGAALAGFVFNVLLIARAPLQLFQAVQTSILPHLTRLATRSGDDEFARAVRVTVLAIAAFAGAVALGLLAIGPWVMDAVLGDKGFDYQRGGLALVGLGMGLHLVAGTLNQAALARRRAGLAAAAWLLCAALFVAWMAAPIVADEVLRVEVGYFGSALLLSGLLYGLYRRD